jgi:predicted Zn-dependent protease
LRTLGKYEVLGELGHGAMGVVYRARDPFINRLVALKTITTGLASDPNLLQRFYREAQSAGGLQHPNIVTIYDMGHDQNVPYIAMELIDGESLEQIIASRKSVPVSMKVSYALQACRALDYAHKRGIIHRDIKPGNMMVNRENVVKVVDFGIARVLETSKTQTGMLIGTFAYMSPEQYSGEHADERSDIWSFGVLMYELVAYQRPFMGENPASLMNGICQQEPKALRSVAPDCPPELEAIIWKALRKSPADRFQTSEDLLLELEPVYKELHARSVAELVEQSRGLIEKEDFAQAREMLREALRVDSSNTQARGLLEKVNTELRKVSIRPKAQQHVDKGKALLTEKKVQEAISEAESALQMDSTYAPAVELKKEAQEELARIQQVAQWMQAAGQRLAEGVPDEAEKLLGRVFEIEPGNARAKELQGQVDAERAERARRARFVAKMQEARGLWTQLDYERCIGILSELGKEFPGEEEVQRLLATVREDQAEQHRQKTLQSTRNLLAAGNHAQARSTLAELQKQFRGDEEIPRLLEEIRVDEAKQRRAQGLAEARRLLAARQYEESVAKLNALGKEFKDDREIEQVLQEVRDDEAEQQKRQSLADARGLLAARQFEECGKLLGNLRARFAGDKEIAELQAAVDAGLREQEKQRKLNEARNLFAGRRYDAAIGMLGELQKEYAADEEILRFGETIRTEQAEDQRRAGIAEARTLLAAHKHEECARVLAGLRTRYAGDSEVGQLEEALRRDKAEQAKLASLTKARTLLGKRSYDECIALLSGVAREFPGEEEVQRLLASAREGLAEQRRLKSLADARKLLADRRYDETIALLTKLKEEFPEEKEVGRLLANANKELAEQQKQQKLTEARTLLAAQKFDEVLAVLDELKAAHPKDAAVQKLRGLVEAERDKQRRAERLKEELEALKKLVSEKRYAELLTRAEQVKAEYPGNTDLTRMIDFARAQQAQIESEKKQRASVDEVQAQLKAGKFEEALRAADSGLRAFPQNAELAHLREQAEAQDRKVRARRMIEQRIKEIKFKINRQDFSEARDLAKETIAMAGPDTDLTQLLNSALVEIQARERKREQEKKLQEIRGLMDAGNLGGAEAALSDAMATQTFDSFDPRVGRVSEAIEAAKNPPVIVPDVRVPGVGAPSAGVPGVSVPGAPANFSKEYAFLQGRPVDPEVTDETETIAQQQAATQPTISSQPTAPILPPVEGPREIPKVPEIKETPRAKSVPAQVTPVAPPTPKKPVEAARTAPPSRETKPAKSVEAEGKELAVAPASPAQPPVEKVPEPPKVAAREFPRRESQQETQREAQREKEAPVAVAAGAQRDFKKVGLLAVGLAVILGVWGVVHFVGSSKTQPANTPAATATNAPAAQPVTNATVKTPSAKPVNPAEAQQKSALDKANQLVATNQLDQALQVLQPAAGLKGPLTADVQKRMADIETLRTENQQREAMATADKRAAAGDYKGAMDALQGAEKLGAAGSALGADIKSKEAAIESAQKSATGKLWLQAQQEVDQGQFDTAKRDFRRAAADDPTRASEAKRYVSEVIPSRQKEEDLYKQARQSAAGGDQQGLQRADDLLGRVAALNGPRKGDAQRMQADVESKLANLKEEMASRQLAALDSAGRASLKAGDFAGARQKASQIRQAGGDPSALLSDIGQAQFQQAVTDYNAAGSKDKSGLERARGEFQSIVRGNGAQSADAQQYVTDINKKLDALNAPPPSPAATPAPTAAAPATSAPAASAPAANTGAPVVNTAAEEPAVRAVIQGFIDAFQARSADGLKKVWPNIPQKRYSGYKNSFEQASSIQMQVQNETVKVSADGQTATVSAKLLQQFTMKGQSTSRADDWVFQLVKRNGSWTINDVR